MKKVMKYSQPNNSLLNVFDELFMSRRDWATRASHGPSVNIKETNEDFLIEVAAPGLTKDVFNIEVEQDQLIISASKEENNSEETVKYSRKEFSFSSFKRSFHLDHTIDTQNIDASYVDGILTIVLPKKEEAKVEIKKIEIK